MFILVPLCATEEEAIREVQFSTTRGFKLCHIGPRKDPHLVWHDGTVCALKGGKEGRVSLPELLEHYTQESCDFTDMPWVKRIAQRLLTSLPDTQLTCVLALLVRALEQSEGKTVMQADEALEALPRTGKALPALIASYAEAGCPVDDKAWVARAARRHLDHLPDSQMRCILYVMAEHVKTLSNTLPEKGERRERSALSP